MSPYERNCNGNCNICNEYKECEYCKRGYRQKDKENINCHYSCYGHGYCYYDFLHEKFIIGSWCLEGYMQQGSNCQDISPCLYATPSPLTGYSCQSCQQGYLKQVIIGGEYSCLQKDWNCDPSRYIQIELFYHNQ